MQKMRNEKGITLTALVITIIVFTLLTSVSINIGTDSINSTKDRNLQSELQIVEQAAISEYSKAVELGKIHEGTNDIPSNFVGEKISGVPAITLSNGNSWYFASNPNEAKGYKSYFRLTPELLEKLEIKNSEHTYIINYYTGEVYNETKQKASTGEDLYIKANKATITMPTDDNTSFVN